MSILNSSSFYRQIVVLFLIGVFCFYLSYALIPDYWAQALVRYGTKPLFYLVYGAILVCAVRIINRRRCRIRLRSIGLLLAMSALACSWIYAPHNFDYKVLNDEYVVPAQAKNLHFSATSDFTVSAIPTYGQVHDLERVVDKRPPAFSVLLAIIHDLTGYRVSSVFILNAGVGFALIFLLLWAVHREHPIERMELERSAWVVALVASLPLFGQTATGAGLDLYNLFLLFLSAYLGYRMLAGRYGQEWLWPWLLVNFLLFNARYESILYVISCAGILLVLAWRERRLPGYPALLCLPVFLMFYVFRHRMFALDADRHWQLEVDVVSPFSVSFFWDNLGHAIGYFFISGVQGSASLPLICFGIIALVILAVRGILGKKRRPGPIILVFLAYGSVVLLNFLLLLCYHWGRLGELEVSRLVLPFFLLMGAGILIVVEKLQKTHARVVQALLLVTVLYVFCFASPGRSMEYALRGNYYAAVDGWAFDLLSDEERRDLLVISNRPVYWNLHDIASMNHRTVAEQIRGFEFHRTVGTHRPYLLSHYRVDPDGGGRSALEGRQLESIYQTELLGEYGYRAYHVAQLRRIVGLRDGVAEKIALSREELAALRRFPLDFWFYFLP